MKALIIEDEIAASMALETLLGELFPDIEVLSVLQSVEESVAWLLANASPELIFMDIHLSDDSSFAIFDRVRVTSPIIFTTAYDEYALKAFDVNSIDYLLKPIDREHLQRAIGKLRSFPAVNDNEKLLERLITDLRPHAKSYKSSILISTKDKLVPLAVSTIAYALIEDKVVTVVTFDGKRYNLDLTLDELGELLDPANFFRANRQYIIARSAVNNISLWFNGKLAVNMSVVTPARVYISKARAREFKGWLTD